MSDETGRMSIAEVRYMARCSMPGYAGMLCQLWVRAESMHPAWTAGRPDRR
jgi:hypothetical protein